MRIEDLEQFVALANSMNYQETADQLYISQSTLSKHIESLEKEIGYELIDRSKRQIKLTESGKKVLYYANVILNERRLMSNSLKKLNNNNLIQINLASTAVMVEYGIINVISKMMRENKLVNFNIEEITNHQMVTLFEHDECDIAFIRENKLKNNLLVRNFVTEPLVAVVSNHNDLSVKDKLDLKEIAKYQIILPPSSHSENQLILQWFKKNHIIPNNLFTANQIIPDISFSTNLIENILTMVKKNVGIAILPKYQVKFYNPRNVEIISLKQDLKSFINIHVNPHLEVQKGRLDLDSTMEHFIKLIEQIKK